ncbi:MAG: nucleoside triphosphate pyrophosphohydrolase [candidate division Zixibacteria bacterium]|nr:nucleoside triphosphate pyrophosphohydrolase [candidate division Zixibacteria bacterium]MCI0595501.1 nucleoside triphosphate pyrophosphohydrolase [candidate division Zixibacteria bacterium]
MRKKSEMERLIGIMATLRGPKGCPWDRKQNHETLVPYLVEEAHEAIEAIYEKNYKKLEEELGDLLLQVVFHAQLAREKKRFDIEKVAKGISAKLIRRHPHVFGKKEKLTSAQVLENWERRKLKEKKTGVLESIPKTLPILFRAQRVQEKAAQFGFDWKKAGQVVPKLKEEIKEIEKDLKKKSGKLEEEIGDLFFTTINLSRHLKVNPEKALKTSVDKFEKRFAFIESSLKKQKKNLGEVGLEELDRLWNKAKKLKT